MEKLRAIQLRKNGFSVKQIAQKLGVSKGSVSFWVKNISVSSENGKALRERMLRGGKKGRKKILQNWKAYRVLHPKPPPYVKPVREIDTFFDKWSSEMAYVLGFFSADGCMYRNKRGSYYVAFTSTDKELIESVKNIIHAENLIETYLQKGNCKMKYTIQIGSKRAFNRLKEIGFMQNKSLLMKFPEVPKSVLCHFVRGYLDGDGCVFSAEYFRKTRNNYYRCFMVTFTSGSYVFLRKLRERLVNESSVGCGSLFSRSKSHNVLSYSGKSARQFYKFLYPDLTVPCLKRKKRVFEKFGPVV